MGVGAGGIMALAGKESGGAKSTLQTYEAEVRLRREFVVFPAERMKCLVFIPHHVGPLMNVC